MWQRKEERKGKNRMYILLNYITFKYKRSILLVWIQAASYNRTFFEEKGKNHKLPRTDMKQNWF